MVAERLFADRVFGFAGAGEEPLGEVVAEVADLHRSVALGVDHELVFGDGLAGGCRDLDRRDKLENRGLDRFNKDDRSLRKEAACQVLFETLLVAGPPLGCRLINLPRARSLAQKRRLEFDIPSRDFIQGCTHDELFLSSIVSVSLSIWPHWFHHSRERLCIKATFCRDETRNFHIKELHLTLYTQTHLLSMFWAKYGSN